MEKIKAFYKAHKVKGLVAIIILLLNYIIAPQSVKLLSDSVDVAKEVKAINKESTNKILDEIEKTVVEENTLKPKKLEAKLSCEPTYVLKTDDIFRNRNLIILDLSTFKVTKDVNEGGKRKVYYSRFGATDEFYTVFTPSKFIDVNAKIKNEDIK